MFELLSSEVNPKRKFRPKWAPESGAKASPFTAAPASRETEAVGSAGDAVQAGTDSGEEMFPDTPTSPMFDPDDPVGSIAAAEKGGFFDSLQQIGAAMMMMSGDKDQSRLGLGLMQGQQRTQQNQQREKRLGAEAGVREKRLQKQAEFSQGIQAADLRLKETDAVMKTAKEIEAISDPAQKRNAFLLATKQLFSHSPTAGALLAGMVKDPANGTAIAMTRKVTDQFQQFALKASALAGSEGAGKALLKKFPTVEHGLDALALKGDLSAEDRNYLAKNPAVVESIGNVMGWPATEAVKAAQKAGMTERAQLEGKAQAAGTTPGTPEANALAERILSKPGVAIDMASRELPKQDAEFIGKVRKEAEEATAKAPIVRQLKTALDSNTFMTGSVAGVRSEASKLLELFGVPGSKVAKQIGNATTADLIQSGAAQLLAETSTDVPRLRVAQEAARDALVNLGKTPEANKILASTLEATINWRRDRAEFTEQYLSDYDGQVYPKEKDAAGKKVPSLYQALRQWDDANPVLTPELEEFIEGARKQKAWQSYAEARRAVKGEEPPASISETETITVTDENRDEYPGLEPGKYTRRVRRQ